MCYDLTEREGDTTMKSNANILMNVKNWLLENDHTQSWLAKQMNIAPSLLSQLFSGERRLQVSHIEKISAITEMSIPDLASSPDNQYNQPVYSLRGRITTKEGESALNQLLLDAEHYVHLLVK